MAIYIDGSKILNIGGAYIDGTTVQEIYIDGQLAWPEYYYYLGYNYDSSTCTVETNPTWYFKSVQSHSVSTGVYAATNSTQSFVTVDNSQTGTTALNFFNVIGCSAVTPTPSPTPTPTPVVFSSFNIGTNTGVGFADQTTACTSTGTSRTVYVAGTETDLYVATVTNGKAIYSNNTLTTLLDGGGLYFKDTTAASSGNTFTISSVGAVATWTVCGASPTATPTPTPSPTPSPSPTPTPTPSSNPGVSYLIDIDSALDNTYNVVMAVMDQGGPQKWSANIQASSPITSTGVTGVAGDVLDFTFDDLSSGLFSTCILEIRRNTATGDVLYQNNAYTPGSTISLYETLSAADVTGTTTFIMKVTAY